MSKEEKYHLEQVLLRCYGLELTEEMLEYSYGRLFGMVVATDVEVDEELINFLDGMQRYAAQKNLATARELDEHWHNLTKTALEKTMKVIQRLN